MMTESELSSPTSTSSSGDLSPKKMDDKTNYRKSNKPMMEKKRRARINSCLSQLKSLVLQAMKKDNSQYSKLEKADILELTVKHLRNVQRYQATSLAQVPDAMSKYRAGFNECASEVMRYLEESQGVNDEARTRILSHLASILSPINALPLQQTHTPILPAPSPMHQQQQQQHHHLQQLQLQQQHAGVFLNPSTQQISIDTNNNKPSATHAAFLTSQANTVDIKNVISGSPTAFQSPIASGVNVPVSLQLPSIATAAMATTQLQLVPSTLPSGQVALVLAPQPVSAMGVYTSTQPARQQLGHDTLKLAHDSLSTQQHLIAAQEDIKPRTVTRCSEMPMALVTKATRSHRVDNSSISGSYQRPITPYQIKRSSSPLPPSSSSSSSTSSSLSQYSLHTNRQSNVVVSSSVPKTTGTTVSVNNNSSNNSGVVKATSTWRPW